MHTYLYIDWNGDGFNYSSPSDYLDPQNDYAIKPGADLADITPLVPHQETIRRHQTNGIAPQGCSALPEMCTTTILPHR